MIYLEPELQILCDLYATLEPHPIISSPLTERATVLFYKWRLWQGATGRSPLQKPLPYLRLRPPERDIQLSSTIFNHLLAQGIFDNVL
jgi:hypothetical protein